MLLGQVLGYPQTTAEALHKKRHGKVDAAQHADLQVALADGRVGQAEIEGQVDQGQTGQSGEQLADTPGQQNITGGDRDDQQVAQPAAGAPGSVEQDGQQKDIQHRQHE